MQFIFFFCFSFAPFNLIELVLDFSKVTKLKEAVILLGFASKKSWYELEVTGVEKLANRNT